MLDKEALYKLKKQIEKDIENLSIRPELTPDDHKRLKDALTSYAMIEAECEKCEYDDRDREGSGRRMRNPMNGRYISSYGYDGMRSGHSIRDRAVDRLERMMDETNSDYERQEISHLIDKIR